MDTARRGSGLFMRHQMHFRTAHQGLKSDMNQISASVSVVEADRSDAPWNFRGLKNKTMVHFNDALAHANQFFCGANEPMS